MDQNNYLTVEVAFKLQMKDYRFILGLKKTWIIALVVGVIQLAAWIIRND